MALFAGHHSLNGTAFALAIMPPAAMRRRMSETAMTQHTPSQGLHAHNSDILKFVEELAVGHVERLRDARRAMITWALAKTHGNVAQAAELLGTSRSTVYRCARARRFHAA